MSNNSTASGSGLGVCSVLTIVFIVLKLTGNITWSWLWVLSPLWLPIAVILSVLAIAGIVATAMSFRK